LRLESLEAILLNEGKKRREKKKKTDEQYERLNSLVPGNIIKINK